MKRRDFLHNIGGFVAGCYLGLGIEFKKPKQLIPPEKGEVPFKPFRSAKKEKFELREV